MRSLSFWSGRRGSNSRPPPWQGGALPDELRPRDGASGRNRTNDTRIFSPLLYLLSYRGILWRAHALHKCFMATPNGLEPSTSSVTGWRANRLHHRAIFYGGNNRARTCDLLLVRQMLSQLSYAPVRLRCVAHLSDMTHYTHRTPICQAFFSIFFKEFLIPNFRGLTPEIG